MGYRFCFIYKRSFLVLHILYILCNKAFPFRINVPHTFWLVLRNLIISLWFGLYNRYLILAVIEDTIFFSYPFHCSSRYPNLFCQIRRVSWTLGWLSLISFRTCSSFCFELPVTLNILLTGTNCWEVLSPITYFVSTVTCLFYHVPISKQNFKIYKGQ